MFPVELISNIASFCTPNDLRCLALVNHTYAMAALSRLYRNLEFDYESLVSMRLCLKHLANNEGKLLLVRSFSIALDENEEHPLAHNTEINIYIQLICDVLPGMVLLEKLDLRLSFLDSVFDSLNPVLAQCKFSLNTLCINLDLLRDEWAKCQIASLKLLVVYLNENDFVPSAVDLELFRSFLHASSLEDPLQLVGMIAPGIGVCAFPQLTVHAGLPKWSARRLEEHIDQSSNFYPIGMGIICLHREMDAETLRHTTQAMALSFPKIVAMIIAVGGTNILLQPWPSDMAAILSWLPLENLIIGGCNDDGLVEESSFVSPPLTWRLGLLAEWTAQSPSLKEIAFPDAVAATFNDDLGAWEIDP